MTKAEIKRIKATIESLQKQMDDLRSMLHLETKESSVVNTNLENRNYDVFICRTQLYMSYAQIANALGITEAQVGESLKVLRDKGLIESSRQSSTLIEDYLPDVKNMKKKKFTRAQMAKELGVSEKTVIRCLERLNK